MARAMNLRGFRRISDLVALPREIQAATKIGGGLMRKAPDLVRASTPAQVESVIGEAWHEAVADMSFSRDPYVAMRSGAHAEIVAGTDLVLADFDFMKEQTGVANTTASVAHNLLKDNQVLKPTLVHNVGIDIFFKGAVGDLRNLFMAKLNVNRDKTTIFEAPLMACVKTLVVADPADTAGSNPSISVGEQGAGGLEVEGHGIPMSKDDNISLDLVFPSSTFVNHATISGYLSMALLMDGEVMEE